MQNAPHIKAKCLRIFLRWKKKDRMNYYYQRPLKRKKNCLEFSFKIAWAKTDKQKNAKEQKCWYEITMHNRPHEPKNYLFNMFIQCSTLYIVLVFVSIFRPWIYLVFVGNEWNSGSISPYKKKKAKEKFGILRSAYTSIIQ